MADMNKPAQDSTPPSAPRSGQSEHTPVPWTYLKRKTLCHVESSHLARPSGVPVCSIPVSREANAALIVEAVNSHAANIAEINTLAERLKASANEAVSLQGQNRALLARNAALEQALRKCKTCSLSSEVRALVESTLTAQSNEQAGTKSEGGAP